MATGFEKFASKTLSEGPLSLTKPTEESKIGTVTRTPGVRKERPVETVEEPAPAPVKPQKVEKDEKLFQMTIQIKYSTKDLLDEMKFRQKKSFKELAEEAFADLYAKYNK